VVKVSVGEYFLRATGRIRSKLFQAGFADHRGLPSLFFLPGSPGWNGMFTVCQNGEDHTHSNGKIQNGQKV
jgi:hypothetical protein